jgi:hypothetical protein
VIHWSIDDWRTTRDVRTADSTLGIDVADLPTDGVPAQCTVAFTLLWLDEARWEGVNFEVTVGAARGRPCVVPNQRLRNVSTNLSASTIRGV